MKIKELESETSQREFADQQNIEADHNSSSSSKDHDFNNIWICWKKKQMKKRHPDVNEPLNIRLEKFKWHFHQAVEEIEKESI